MPETLTVATWNVNSVRTRLDHVMRFLGEHSPDVLCLQELKCADGAMPAARFVERGYHLEAYGQKAYNGVAIVSPYAIADVTRGFTDDAPADPQSRIICGTVEGVRVVNVYVPNGSEVGSDKYDYKLAWMERMTGELVRQGVGEVPLILVGDFNVALTDADVHDPARWQGRVLCSDPEREAARGWLKTGLSDPFPAQYPAGKVFTWWDYRAGAVDRNEGLRIDHTWHSDRLACTDLAVVAEPRGWDKPSDHAPVVATLTRLVPAPW